MSATAASERRKARRAPGDRIVIKVELKDRMGNPRWVTADLLDISEDGAGVSITVPLPVGTTIGLRGKLGKNGHNATLQARVQWCVERPDGTFRAGLFLLNGEPGSGGNGQAATAEKLEEMDLYEVMELSPNADSETISRVYRFLAQRYHPDNKETGNSEMFVRLAEAYRILSDPEQRARYDARHRQTRQLHWRIFDQAENSKGPEAEKRKRQGILGLLYAKFTHDPEHSAINIFEFERLLGCPREHLQAALWYLKGKGRIQRTDNGYFSITVTGVDEFEAETVAGAIPEAKRLRAPSQD